MLAGIVSADNSTKRGNGTGQEFGKGYYAFFGVIAGFFVTAVLGLTVVIGYGTIQEGSPEAAPSPAPDTTVAGQETPAGDPAAGEAIFASTCSVCHGAGGEGIEGLGKSLINNVFVASLSDEELLAFLNEGRPPSDPDNTTGIAMPPKGGNVSLTDDDLNDVIAFLRTLQ